jgi:hypothetical protein
VSEWETLIQAPLSAETTVRIQVRGPFGEAEYARLTRYLALLPRQEPSPTRHHDGDIGGDVTVPSEARP